MWLGNDQFTEYHRAVLKGEPGRLLKLFTELFHPDNQSSKNLTLCPQCQKTLERKMHPYLEYFVHACPDRHGAWMSPDVSSKVRDLLVSQITQSNRRRKTFQTLLLLGLGFSGIMLLANGPAVFKKTWTQYQESKIGPSYWPSYHFQDIPPLTEENTAIENPLDRRYLAQIAKLLEGGAANRMNFDKVIKSSRSPEDYEAAFKVYRKNHQKFLAKLQAIYTPEKLIPFHASLEKAASAQLSFYAAFAEQKRKHPETAFSKWLPHPALRSCNRELLKAYDFILKQYPEMDSSANHALESRLCWFDIV